MAEQPDVNRVHFILHMPRPLARDLTARTGRLFRERLQAIISDAITRAGVGKEGVTDALHLNLGDIPAGDFENALSSALKARLTDALASHPWREPSRAVGRRDRTHDPEREKHNAHRPGVGGPIADPLPLPIPVRATNGANREDADVDALFANPARALPRLEDTPYPAEEAPVVMLIRYLTRGVFASPVDWQVPGGPARWLEQHLQDASPVWKISLAEACLQVDGMSRISQTFGATGQRLIADWLQKGLPHQGSDARPRARLLFTALQALLAGQGPALPVQPQAMSLPQNNEDWQTWLAILSTGSRGAQPPLLLNSMQVLADDPVRARMVLSGMTPGQQAGFKMLLDEADWLLERPHRLEMLPAAGIFAGGPFQRARVRHLMEHLAEHTRSPVMTAWMAARGRPLPPPAEDDAVARPGPQVVTAGEAAFNNVVAFAPRSAFLRKPDYHDRCAEMHQPAGLPVTLPVSSAGLILIWPFLSGLFTSLGLLKNQAFVSLIAQHTAVACLDLLVWEGDEPAEWRTPLNKWLCGLSWDVPLLGEARPDDEARAVLDGFVQSLSSRIPGLHRCVAEDIRILFLQRPGELREKEGQWFLNVERESIDVLLGDVPWPVHTLSLPWTLHPLNVIWL